MGRMARDPAGRAIRGAALWVLEGNVPARRFYEALGGAVVGRREDHRGKGTLLVEVACGWATVTSLAEEAP